MIRFIGAGFQRSGTTWLYNQLRSFDEVYMPPKKEIHYFDKEIKNPLKIYKISNRKTSSKSPNIKYQILAFFFGGIFQKLGFYRGNNKFS